MNSFHESHKNEIESMNNGNFDCKSCLLMHEEFNKKRKIWEENKKEYDYRISELINKNFQLEEQNKKLIQDKERAERLFERQNQNIAEYETNISYEKSINDKLNKEICEMKESYEKVF